MTTATATLTVSRRLPLYVWAALASQACMIVGWNWDISWHRSIGRDTVWTPAHVAIYSALAIAFAYNAALVLGHTFGARKGEPALRVLGFAGTAGAFITLWAILLQFAAILFDNWWHDVYGLDVIVFSPPHYTLSVAIAVFHFGQFVVVASYANTAPPEQSVALRRILLVLWSFLIGHQLITDYTWGPMQVRSVLFMATSALFVPFSLVMIVEYLRSRWAGAQAALIYALWCVLLMQIFQLFPASPQFGPVYHHIPFLLPPPFPLLLFIPAAAVGAVLYRMRSGPSWARHLLVGLTFLVVFTSVNWATSAFMAGPWGDNRFFAGGYPSFVYTPGYRVVTLMALDGRTVALALLSVGLAALSSWSGVAVGRWLRRIVR